MKRFFWIFLLIPALFSCDEDKYSASDDVEVRPLNTEEKFLVNASNDFALKVLGDLQKLNNDNVVFSPLGLGMSAGILSNSVEEVNQDLLGIQELRPIEVNKAFYEVGAMLPNIDKHVQLNFANALWNQSSLSLSEDFTTRIMAYYNADVRSMNFEKESAEKYINKWIDLKTNHQFTSIGKFDQRNDLFLVNASTFSFPFYNDIEVGQTEIKTEPTAVFTYDNESLTLNEILLGDNKFRLITIAPKNGKSLSDIIGHLSIKNINTYRDNEKPVSSYQIPDINFEFEHNYADVFNQNWLSHFIVNESVSNLNSTNYQFNITHKAAVKINFTPSGAMNSLNSGSTKSEPYLFFITEPNTELLLFAGISR